MKFNIYTFLALASVALLAYQCYTAMIILPEFHVAEQKEYQKQLDELDKLGNDSQAIRKACIQGRWNGENGFFLALKVLITDGLMGCLLIVAVAIYVFESPSRRPQATNVDAPPILK